jgi:hypothetical protein
MGGKHGTWVIEIKRRPAAKLQKGNHNAMDDLKPQRSFCVHGGIDRFPMTARIDPLPKISLLRKDFWQPV